MDTVIKSIISDLKQLIESTLNIKFGPCKITGNFIGYTSKHNYLWLTIEETQVYQWWNSIFRRIDVGDVLIEVQNKSFNLSREKYDSTLKYIISASDPLYLEKIKEAWTQ